MRRPITPDKLKELKLKLKARRTELTDKEVAALPPAPAGARYDVNDPGLAGFGVRINDKGRGTYNLTTRFPGKHQPARREIGKVGEVTLAEARETARKWLALIKKGVDPKHEVERERQAALRQQSHTFASVAELWLKQHASKLRTFKDIERTVRFELIGTPKEPRLGDRPIAEITKGEAKELLQAIVDDGRVRTAHIAFEHLRSIFVWAEDEGDFGLEVLPTDRIKPRKLFGKRKIRSRVLTDVEIRAFWKATGRMGYAHGPLFRLLLLTGARLREVGDVSWNEIDLDQKLLVIPPERFKSDATHVVPLSSAALALLDELPRLGDRVFTSDGVHSIENFAHAKRRLDALMTEELGHESAPFVLHDLRRTMRTRLAGLRIPDTIAEKVIGHGPKDQLQRVYDQHQYLVEMREALELWGNRLRDIIEPPPANVVQFGERASA